MSPDKWNNFNNGAFNQVRIGIITETATNLVDHLGQWGFYLVVHAKNLRAGLSILGRLRENRAIFKPVTDE